MTRILIELIDFQYYNHWILSCDSNLKQQYLIENFDALLQFLVYRLLHFHLV